MHRHTYRALHQRLDDHGRNTIRTALQQQAHRGDRARCHLTTRFAIDCLARIRTHHHVRAAEHPAVRLGEYRHIRDTERTYRFAVIAALEANEFLFLGVAGIAPVMKTHLQCDLNRRRAIGRIKAMPEMMARER